MLEVRSGTSHRLLSLYVPVAAFFGRLRYAVPACAPCASRFWRQYWGRTIASWVLVAVAVAVVYPFVASLSWGLRRTAGAAMCIVALSPYILFEVMWPRFFEVHVQSESVEFMFASGDYADAFARANDDAA